MTASANTRRTPGEVTLISGASWLTVATLTVGVLNYAYALGLTHLLPAHAYARFAAAQALLLTAGTIAAASIPWVLAQRLARTGESATISALTGMALLANIVQGLLAAAVIAVVASSFGDAATVATVAFGVLAIFVSSTTVGWLQGQGRFRALAAVKVIEVVVKCAVGIGLALLTHSAAAPLAAFGAGAAVVLLIGLHRFGRPVLRPEPVVLRSLWRDALGVACVQGLVSVLASLDVILVAVLPIPAEQAAGYQAAMILARVPLYLAGAVAAVALPMAATAAARQAAGQYREALRLYLSVAVPFTLLLGTAPEPLVYLVFPAEFSMIRTILAWTACSGLLIGTVELATTFYQAQGAYRVSLARQVPAVGFALAAVLVGHQIHGVLGVAAGALAGSGVASAGLLLDSARRWPGSVQIPAAALARCACAAGTLALVAAWPPAWIAGALAVTAWTVRRVLSLRGNTGANRPDDSEVST